MSESKTKAIAVATSDRSEETFSNAHSNNNRLITPQQLLVVLKTLPTGWGLTAVGGNKATLGKAWQKTPLILKDFEKASQTGSFEHLLVESKGKPPFPVPLDWWCAIGVLCGTPSGGLLFVDHDGASCDGLIASFAGCPVAEALPKTPTVTSGRPGRYQAIYRVPERYWGALATKVIKTGTIGDDGKPEQLEFRWNGCQSVVAGHHPSTGGYEWLPSHAPEECEVAEAPAWMIEQMLEKLPLHQPTQTQAKHQSVSQTWTDRDWASSYLAAIPSAEDYDTWIQVGMALQSVSEDLLADWDGWSRGAANYEPGACEKHWQSFKPTKGIGLGTLGQLAKQNGWQSPSKESRGNRPTLTVIDGSGSVQAIPAVKEEADEDFEDLAQEVQVLVNLTEETAPIQTLLSPLLTAPLSHRANQFNVPLEAFVGLLLPIAASLLKVGTRLEINAASDHHCVPILWTGLVGESGANKSPILDSLLRPLECLQAQADEHYELACAQYEADLEASQKRPKEERRNKLTPPDPREYYLQDATLEAIAACLSTQPDRGVVIAIDEFASFFNGFNQYRAGGRGNDRQKFLSAYDGRAIKVNRKSGNRISLPKTSISLTGTIQPGVLRKHMSDLAEVDGFWARFAWVPLPLTVMPPPGDGAHYDLSGLLQSLYRGLESLAPECYRFDQRGQAIWRDWHIFCEDHKVNEPNPSLRAVYPKSKERAARVALVVHCINAVVEDRIPEPVIPSTLLESAIAFTKWSIGQTRLIYADAGAVSHPKTAKLVRFIERFRNSEWIVARQVTHWWSPKPKPKADAARAFMQQVVALGYAIDNSKTGRDYAIRIKENAGNSGNKTPQSLDLLGTEAGNKSGNSLVTTDGNNPEMPTEPALEMGNNLDSFLDIPNSGITTAPCSHTSNNGEASSESPVALLPGVTTIVTALQPLSSKEPTGICYPVTASMLQVGDRVLLTREGVSRPADELRAIWTVKAIQEQKVVIHCEDLGDRVFPQAWLERYA